MDQDNITKILSEIPLSVKIRSILRQNDVSNWVDGEYKGDPNQLENTAKALEWVLEEHIKSLPK